ncbi:MlaD family protein [Flexithrix dorotheae]|uniref:MlaD family protein n=1 Tax=Flexithrix dorotheae TaxID=70993 RepID=UPI000375FC35|nr:MlaD family protein [Flexithrix dorotheae]
MSKEFKVGILTVIAGVILYWGVRFLKGIDLFSDTSVYYAYYENIGGLQPANPVLLNGMSVGRVLDIEIVPEKNNKVMVSLEVANDIQIGDQTVALLTDPGLLSDKAVELKINTVNGYLKSGDTLRSEIDNGVMDILEEKAFPIINTLDSTFASLNIVLKGLDGLGDELKSTLVVARDKMNSVNTQELDGTLQNFRITSENLAKMSEELKPLATKLNTLADSLNEAPIKSLATEMNATMANLNTTVEKINNAEGSLGLLINDKKLYEDMDQTIRDLDSLLVNLREHPNRYVQFSVFGKKDKEKKKKDK